MKASETLRDTAEQIRGGMRLIRDSPLCTGGLFDEGYLAGLASAARAVDMKAKELENEGE